MLLLRWMIVYALVMCAMLSGQLGQQPTHWHRDERSCHASRVSLNMCNETRLYAWGLSAYLAVLAQSQADQFDYEAAVATIDEAVRLADTAGLPDRYQAILYTRRGELIFLIYEWDRVETNLRIAIELDPSYARAYYQRGVLYYTMVRRQDALADFETYLALAPQGTFALSAQQSIERIQAELDVLGD